MTSIAFTQLDFVPVTKYILFIPKGFTQAAFLFAYQFWQCVHLPNHIATLIFEFIGLYFKKTPAVKGLGECFFF